MQSKFSRRAIVKGGLIAGAVIPAMGFMSRSADAAALPPLDPKDPTAQALGFITDATKVDALEIHWPDRTVEKLKLPEVDRIFTVEEGKGVTGHAPAAKTK